MTNGTYSFSSPTQVVGVVLQNQESGPSRPRSPYGPDRSLAGVSRRRDNRASLCQGEPNIETRIVMC